MRWVGVLVFEPDAGPGRQVLMVVMRLWAFLWVQAVSRRR